MNDIDEALRTLRAGVEPTPGSLARARDRVLHGPTGPTRPAGRPAGRWIALPAVAAAVAATAVTASLVLNQSPTARPPSPPLATASAPSTAEIIEAWALDLEAGPPAPPAVEGQTITVITHAVENGDSRTAESTVQRDGLLIIDSSDFGQMASFQQYVAEQRETFARTGPTWHMPTPAWLDALDPSPANILAVAEAALGCPCPNRSEVIWGDIIDLIAKADIVLPPALRAGLLRALATMPGVTAYESTVENVPYRVLALTEPGARRELYLDPATGHFAGYSIESTPTSWAPVTTDCRSASSAGCPTPGPTGDDAVRDVVSWWEQSLVTP